MDLKSCDRIHVMLTGLLGVVSLCDLYSDVVPQLPQTLIFNQVVALYYISSIYYHCSDDEDQLEESKFSLELLSVLFLYERPQFRGAKAQQSLLKATHSIAAANHSVAMYNMSR